MLQIAFWIEWYKNPWILHSEEGYKFLIVVKESVGELEVDGQSTMAKIDLCAVIQILLKKISQMFLWNVQKVEWMKNKALKHSIITICHYKRNDNLPGHSNLEEDAAVDMKVICKCNVEVGGMWLRGEYLAATKGFHLDPDSMYLTDTELL